MTDISDIPGNAFFKINRVRINLQIDKQVAIPCVDFDAG